jgi:hypothetical protein
MAPLAVNDDAALILACVRARTRGAPGEVRAAVKRVGDWHAVMGIAAAHGVLPLVTSALIETTEAGVPPGVGAWARERLDENVQRTLVLSLELRRVRAGLAREGIRSIALKGPALAQHAYGAPYLRRCRDLDLLVDPVALWPAHEAVQALGYRPFEPLRQLEPPRQRDYLDQAGQAEYGHDAHDVSIDLQCRIAPRFLRAPAFDELWQRRLVVHLPGGPVDALGDHDLVLALCLHGLRHGWERLQWVVDVALLAASIENDRWAAIRAEAERWGAGRAVALGLGIAERTAGLQLDGPAKAWVRSDGKAARRAARASAALFVPMSRWRRAWTNFAMQWSSQDRPANRVAYLAAVVTTPSAADWVAWRLPRALSWAYTWLRPFRLLADYAGLWSKPPRA